MTDQDHDQDVREMLRAKAESIRPSADGLRAIEAKLASAPSDRRRPPMALMAAAALLVIGMVGAVLVLRNDDATSVDVGPVATTPTTTGDGGFAAFVPPGVWPWPGDPVDDTVFSDPVMTARAYVASRVTDVGATTDSGFQQGDAHSGEVVFTGDVSTTVLVRKDADDRWYVVASSSDLVSLHVVDGGTIAHIETGGTLIRTTTVSVGGDSTGEGGEMVGGEEFELGYTLGRDDAALRELFVLDTLDGTTAITEVSFRATGAPPDQPMATVNGVWPFPQDEVTDPLTDPVATAVAYLDARVGGVTDATTVGDYVADDNSSGSVTFTGEIETTVYVRMLAGTWHVESAQSDLVTLSDDDGDGALVATVNAPGWLMSHVVLSSGSSEPLVDAAPFEAGDEITEGLSFDPDDGDVVKAVRFLLTTGEDGVKGLTEVAFRPPFQGALVPADALSEEASLDGREAAQLYLTDRLGERTVTINDFTDLGDGQGEVTWEAGVIRLQLTDGYWHVVEAIGDSVQLNAAYFQDGAVHGEITVAERGALTISTNDGSIEIDVTQDGEGTLVPFEFPTEVTAGPVRVVFETESGFVSLAERVVA